MDFPDLAKLAFSRVQQMEPHHVGKILGCILLKEPDEGEMVQLAYGSDAMVYAKINEAKATLTAIYARCSGQHHHPIGAGYRGAAAAGVRRHFSPAAPAFGFQYWSEHAPVPKAQPDFGLVDVAAEGHYAQQQNYNGFDDHRYEAAAGGYYYATTEDSYYNGGARNGGAGGALPPRAAARRASGMWTRRPSCHYFVRGICKNGQNCPYPHHQSYADAFADDSDHGPTPPALEKLETEITELLNSRHGQPLSIASLPTLYGERYGKSLQAEGYLTESQRHGKAGYSLTKLLSRINKIRVIERPHGQHSVVLAEDAPKYTEFEFREFRNERIREFRSERGGAEMGSVSSSSHQIYLTFPAESTFVEEDVATYFGQFGPVRDVRIPCQERRMFGFVSFHNSETVSTILTRRNPHFICGSRVLVKPYREKSKCMERTMYVDRMKPMHYYPTRYYEVDPDLYPEDYEASNRVARKQIVEKRERQIEIERRRFAGISLEPLPQQFAYFDCNIEDVNPLNCLPADAKDVNMMDHRSFVVPDSLELVSTSQAPETQASNNFNDQESSQIELLPESPFASAAPAGNGISTLI